MLPVHGQRGELHRYTGVQDVLAADTVKSKVFDGVAVDQTNQVIYTFEFKRTSDREHGYVLQCDERATEQYASLLQIVRGTVASKGWESASSQFHRWDEIHESGSVE